MRIEKFVHRKVRQDGTFVNERGAVETRAMIRMSSGEGCDLEDCHCSDGYWISIGLPRTSGGIIEGIKVKFDDKKEFDKFMKNRQLIGE